MKECGCGGDSKIVLCNIGVRKRPHRQSGLSTSVNVDEGAGRSEGCLVFQPVRTASEKALIHTLA